MASPELMYYTCRFCNVPSTFDERSLRNVIPLEKDEHAIGSSLARDYNASKRSLQIGTVTWNQRPARLRSMTEASSFKVSSDLKLQAHYDEAKSYEEEMTVDIHFRGFTPLNRTPETTEQATLVVAVTGLGGKPFMSWQHEKGPMWLRDFVPRDALNTQVFTYGYPSKLRGSGSHARLFDYTSFFLHELQYLVRANASSINVRPIVLIGHSLGGLIIKQAIIEAATKADEYSNLIDSIYSLFLFGVPHRGLNTAAMEEMVRYEPTKGLVEELKEDSTLIRSLNNDFPSASATLKIVTCHELLETPTSEKRDGEWKRTGPLAMMVGRSSACLYSANEEILPLNANHSMIAKLADAPGTEYQKIRELLVEHTNVARETVQRRQLRKDCITEFRAVDSMARIVFDAVNAVDRKSLELTDRESRTTKERSFIEGFSSYLSESGSEAIFSDHNLSVSYPIHITAILRKLKATFSSFTNFAMQYHEPFRAREGDMYFALPDFKEGDTTGRVDLLEDMLQQCQRSTKDLRETLVFALLSESSGTNDEQGDLQRRAQFQKMGLTAYFNKQHAAKFADLQEIRPLLGKLEHDSAPYEKAELQFTKYHCQDASEEAETVIVEYRQYLPSLRLASRGRELEHSNIAYMKYLDAVKARMRSLAAVLTKLSVADEEEPDAREQEEDCNLFRCLGYLEEPDLSRYAFLFKIPQGLSLKAATQLISLESYVDTFRSYDQSVRSPRLEQKFSLAYHICRAIIQLHSFGWVHKNIRSRHIILVPKGHDSANIASRKNFQEYVAYLKSFEFARPELGKSSGKADFDPEANLYRHPDRQDEPKEIFNKEHDLYAVGVVLIEIGFWTTAPNLKGIQGYMDRVRKGEGGLDPNGIKDQFLVLVRKYLPSVMGTKYAETVEKCLCGFGVVEDDKQRRNLGLAFYQQVGRIFEAGVKL